MPQELAPFYPPGEKCGLILRGERCADWTALTARAVVGMLRRHLEAPPGNSPSESDKPRWDQEQRELWLGELLCRKYHKQPAKRQTTILRAFQEENWPKAIDNPLPPESDLAKTLSRLNEGITGLRFRADGTGRRIVWEVTPSGE